MILSVCHYPLSHGRLYRAYHLHSDQRNGYHPVWRQAARVASYRFDPYNHERNSIRSLLPGSGRFQQFDIPRIHRSHLLRKCVRHHIHTDNRDWPSISAHSYSETNSNPNRTSSLRLCHDRWLAFQNRLCATYHRSPK